MVPVGCGTGLNHGGNCRVLLCPLTLQSNGDGHVIGDIAFPWKPIWSTAVRFLVHTVPDLYGYTLVFCFYKRFLGFGQDYCVVSRMSPQRLLNPNLWYPAVTGI
jgi:hypothetical protein